MSHVMFEYRGWDVILVPHAAEQINTGPAGVDVPSIWGGSLKAFKPRPNKPGHWYVIQPLWLTVDEAKKIKTDLDKQSAMMYMVQMGRRRLEAAIDMYESGQMTPEVEAPPAPPPDPAKDATDLSKMRIIVDKRGVHTAKRNGSDTMAGV